MTQDPLRSSDDLLERARRLEERAEAPVGDAPGPARPEPPPEQRAGWLGSRLQVLRPWLRRGGRVLAWMGRQLYPLARLFRALGRQLRRFAIFVSCKKDETGVRTLAQFSVRRLLLSILVAFLCYVLIVVLYVFGTRREGSFIINNYHLVDGESDVYQLGGCMRTESDQLSCDDHDAEIVLIRPSWIPGMGLNPISFDEEAGQIPIQGECRLGVYGWYLRGPSLTRGLLKPVAYSVSHCRGALPASGAN